jgi:hypothetical protein
LAILLFFGLPDGGHNEPNQSNFFFVFKPEIEKQKISRNLKRISSSAKDSIPLALHKNLPKESTQESQVPRLVPPLQLVRDGGFYWCLTTSFSLEQDGGRPLPTAEANAII